MRFDHVWRLLTQCYQYIVECGESKAMHSCLSLKGRFLVCQVEYGESKAMESCLSVKGLVY